MDTIMNEKMVMKMTGLASNEDKNTHPARSSSSSHG
jgi:hypothetical protein